MVNWHLGFPEQLVYMTMEERRHQSETDRLLRQARLVRPGRFSRPLRRLLHQLGRGLAALGENLQQRARSAVVRTGACATGSLADQGMPEVCSESSA